MEMSLIGIFATVVFAHFLALISPGPDFVILVKSAIKNESKKAIGVALGISIANALYIALCLIGVGSLLASSVYIMIGLKVAGGLFLIYLAIQALRAKKSDYASLSVQVNKKELNNTTFFKEFVVGFMSGILNPKNVLFYLSLFTVVLTKDVSLTFKVMLGVWMTSVVFLWDSAIVFILSGDRVRRKFAKLAYYIDKVTGAILGLVGFKIVKTALTKSSL
ncbi:threonine efflux protein [Paraglaciecola mesophila KMM 241]|uniref:Threonine efflux protein n=1 Tax=Paraglaciecola mesophila KMM 241 TaxID=1128912 RepID=K6Z1R1_9ALTE|nr:LysE family transporter [Paraglaciecola mesophila]GAC24317.1 threonine efflux protein [Paraglaciecola mesophila KMM 241]|tara:strand:+ start:1487 stop:2146 length:660 start_codon:yes stop_codon:yes gene_type:complete